MKRNSGPIHTGGRSSTKDKQRKTNRIYNISITVVIVLILIVGASILFSKDETKQASTTIKEDTPKQTEESDTKTSEVKDKDQDTASKTDDSSTSEDQDGTDAEQGTEDPGQDDSKVILGSEDENDENTETSDLAESVGTPQTSKAEITNFDKGSTNWAEMEQAVAQGAGISTDNMTILWLGNGGAPGKAVGTVSAKDTKQVYRVNIEWVEGSGWKPVNVEKK
ncbi:YrrS family protein [Bacillus cihuensis]|uniref:YrrS family protein n=1 Tax=Bacillus cihuensis TaxID=1208599 RepID=UPI00041F7F9B|nr:YrrS family protein [Bacillus cihuensis]